MHYSYSYGCLRLSQKFRKKSEKKYGNSITVKIFNINLQKKEPFINPNSAKNRNSGNKKKIQMKKPLKTWLLYI